MTRRRQNPPQVVEFARVLAGATKSPQGQKIACILQLNATIRVQPERRAALAVGFAGG